MSSAAGGSRFTGTWTNMGQSGGSPSGDRTTVRRSKGYGPRIPSRYFRIEAGPSSSATAVSPATKPADENEPEPVAASALPAGTWNTRLNIVLSWKAWLGYHGP